jgi:carbonic anhydrase
MENIKRFILENKAWAKGNAEIDPDYFSNMAKDQNPDMLWIGCADSRVAPDEIINAKPGSVFVHRNIANLVYSDDENLMSVIEYAVLYLKVKYIVVCGHYNCGGVKAAYDGIDNKRLCNWTKDISELKDSKEPKDFKHLVELNVERQINKLKTIPAIQQAWQSGNHPKLVGWIYDIHTGLIKEQLTYIHQ